MYFFLLLVFSITTCSVRLLNITESIREQMDPYSLLIAGSVAYQIAAFVTE